MTIFQSVFVSLYVLLFFSACQEGSETQDFNLKKGKRSEPRGEFIYRKQSHVTKIPPMEPLAKTFCPERKFAKNLPKITKEYFRCQGSFSNPPKTEQVRGEIVRYNDCGGSCKHSLPLGDDDRERIYPILLDILNYIQIQTGKKVVITSGHRCPEHNTYVDPSPSNQTSKHQIGAEVDFYVQGMENMPEAVVKIICEYYKTHPEKEYREFVRYEKKATNVSIKPWMNKEIFIKQYLRHEGRNFDNRHPYPYISLQVRYDSKNKVWVNYSWDLAFRRFLRY